MTLSKIKMLISFNVEKIPQVDWECLTDRLLVIDEFFGLISIYHTDYEGNHYSKYILYKECKLQALKDYMDELVSEFKSLKYTLIDA